MNYEEYYTCLGEAKGCHSPEDFLAEYGYPVDCPYSPDGLIRMCEIVYAVSQEDWNRVIELSGGNMAAFSRKYGIPYTTLQHWTIDKGDTKRSAPVYVMQLIGYAMIAEIPTGSEETDNLYDA